MDPHEHDHPGGPDKPAPETTRPERTDVPGTPDAIQAADVDRKPSTEAAGADPAMRKARGVDWVRTSDLLARGSGLASRLAIDFEANLAHKAHEPLARGVKHLGAKLPPVSAFGRGHSREGAGRGPVGMS